MAPYRGLRRLLFETYFATMPLHAWKIRGRNVRNHYLQLKKTETYSRDELDHLQLSKLIKHLEYVSETSLFYRERFRQVNFDPTQLTSLNDLKKIPLLEKSEVREHLDTSLKNSVLREKNKLPIVTSGSTGQPFKIYADREQLEVRFASTLRAMEWTGWRFGDKQARLWHQTLGMSPTQIARERLDALLLRRLFIPAFEISSENIELFIEKLRRHKPVLLDGYAESLNFLASYISSGGAIGFQPRAVISSAQALPSATRNTIEQGLETQVFDKYGSREFSGIAYECKAHTGHHVVDETYIVELLVDGRPAVPGEIGEIVITDLYNKATPLIRYRIGDLAVALAQGPCECGMSHTRIGEIEGRTQAIVHCANGRWMPGTFFAHFFKDYESTIKFFQIVQNEKGKFVLNIVPATSRDEIQITKILDELRKYVGNTEIFVEYVDAIPLVRTGKRSPVISTVAEDFQAVRRQTIGELET